jgi:hypothetical protein
VFDKKNGFVIFIFPELNYMPKLNPQARLFRTLYQSLTSDEEVQKVEAVFMEFRGAKERELQMNIGMRERWFPNLGERICKRVVAMEFFRCKKVWINNDRWIKKWNSMNKLGKEYLEFLTNLINREESGWNIYTSFYATILKLVEKFYLDNPLDQMYETMLLEQEIFIKDPEYIFPIDTKKTGSSNDETLSDEGDFGQFTTNTLRSKKVRKSLGLEQFFFIFFIF